MEGRAPWPIATIEQMEKTKGPDSTGRWMKEGGQRHTAANRGGRCAIGDSLVELDVVDAGVAVAHLHDILVALQLAVRCDDRPSAGIRLAGYILRQPASRGCRNQSANYQRRERKFRIVCFLPQCRTCEGTCRRLFGNSGVSRQVADEFQIWLTIG